MKSRAELEYQNQSLREEIDQLKLQVSPRTSLPDLSQLDQMELLRLIAQQQQQLIAENNKISQFMGNLVQQVSKATL